VAILTKKDFDSTSRFLAKVLFISADKLVETYRKALSDRFKAMDVTAVQSSIEAVNRLVALVVSRSVSMVQDLAATQVENAAAQAAGAAAPMVQGPAEPGLGEQIDLLV
jgi:hypothetical protein